MSKILKSTDIILKNQEPVSISNYNYFLAAKDNYNSEQLENSEEFQEENIKIVREQAEKVMFEAREQAEKEAREIVEKALEEAEIMKEKVFEKAKKDAYEKGLEEAKEEINKKLEELDNKIKENETIRQTTLKKLEKEIVEFIIDISKKILTKSFEINPETITYLVRKGLTQVKNFEDLKIYVSEENYEFVEQNKNSILGIDTENYKIQIVKDTSLTNTECFIETNFGTINCSCFEQFEGIKNTLSYMLE